jgi:hypothetical protein
MLRALHPHETEGKGLEQALTAAAAADPLSEEPCRLLAEHELQLWQENRAAESRRRFAAAAEAMLHLRPKSSSAWRQVGQWYVSIAALTRDPEDARLAAGYFERSVQLYPTSAVLRAELAEAQAAAGDDLAAGLTAAEACRLDASTPHLDKQLTSPQRKRMREMASGSR